MAKMTKKKAIEIVRKAFDTIYSLNEDGTLDFARLAIETYYDITEPYFNEFSDPKRKVEGYEEARRMMRKALITLYLPMDPRLLP